MGETTKTANKVQKKVKRNWFKGLKTEFKKIVWIDKETLTKQSVAAIIVTVLLGIIIALVDAIIKFGIDLIIR
ncbi:MAG TPA: preprotein translocase subunit SecE [Clostridiales bacterium]|nr:preprotein translocase subunit SecE [Clostridiales bacterium]